MRPGRGGRRRPVVLALVALFVAVTTLVHLGRSLGSTARERQAVLPGDDEVVDPCVQTDQAITIAAPPSAVWPWLARMGWGRAGWYTARWAHRLLLPADGASAGHILPELRDVSVGTFIPDARPATGRGFHVLAVQPESALVLRSTNHLPQGWRDRARLDWTWAFVLTPAAGGRTRLHVRSRWLTSPWWLTLGGHLVVVPLHRLLSRDMLRGIRARAEGGRTDR